MGDINVHPALGLTSRMRVLDQDNDILFAARLFKTEAAAQARFLHAFGDGMGALWRQIGGCWKRQALQKNPPPSRRRVVIIEAGRTHGKDSLDRQTTSATGSRPYGDRGHLGTGILANER